MSNDFFKRKIIEKKPNKIENTRSVTFVFFERNEFDELIKQYCQKQRGGQKK